ncbi:MAG: efflux RND transporter periplasmic adaptor subunit [Alphaproteobacteria bacterium]
MKRQFALWKQAQLIAALLGGSYGGLYLTGVIGSSDGSQSHDTRGRKHRGRNNTAPVIVEPVKLGKAVDKIQAIGNGLAKRSITLFPKVSGIIAHIDFTAGHHVKTGDVILKLDDAHEKISVRLAEEKLADARRTLKRNLSLLPKKAVAETKVDATRIAVKIAELELQKAKEALADRSIIAPFDGVLGIPQVELGDRVSETTAIASLDDRSVLVVEFEAPEIYVKRLALGHKIDATNPGFRGQRFSGKIVEIDSRIDKTTRSLKIRAELPNPDDRLRSGMSFMVSLTLEGGEYPTIAELALLWERDGAYVWRVTNGKAEKVKVSVVKRVAGRVLVDGDLAKGQLVIVEGTQRLRPGRRIRFDKPKSADKKGKAGL